MMQSTIKYLRVAFLVCMLISTSLIHANNWLFEHQELLYSGAYQSPTSQFQNLIFAPSNSGVSVGGAQRINRVGRKVDTDLSFGLVSSQVDASSTFTFDFVERSPGVALFQSVTLDTKVEVDQSGIGFWVKKDVYGSLGRGSTTLTFEYVDIEINTSNDFDFGGVLTGVRTNSYSDKAFLGAIEVSPEVFRSGNLGLGLTQRFGMPLDGSSIVGKSASIGLGLTYDFGGEAKRNKRPLKNRCGAVDLSFSQSIGTLSDSGDTNPDDYIGEFTYVDGARIESEDWRARLYWHWDKKALGCWLLGASKVGKKIDLNTGQIDDALGLGRPINRSMITDVDGYQVSIGYSFSKEGESSLYFEPSLGIAVLSGELSEINLSGGVSEVKTSDLEAVLPSLNFTSGVRHKLSQDVYSFYEITTSRYDGRPFGSNLNGWEHSVRIGLGRYF